MSNVATPIDSSYKLVFDDEFNGTSLNASVWDSKWFSNGSGPSKPINSDETAAYNQSQVSVSGGDLHLNTISSPTTVNGVTYPYQTGAIKEQGYPWTYGYFEARVYLPPASSGVIANWPVWWTSGQNWPADGEIDIAEGLSGRAAYHFHDSANPGGIGGAASGDYTGWHVFGALWKPGEIDWYYDGKQVYTLTSGITSSPMQMVLTNGIGKWGGPVVTPSDMMVDYVHVYQTGPNATAVTPQAGYGGPGDTGGTVTPPPPPPPPPSTSPDGTKITSPSDFPIVDAGGNSWSLVQSSTSSKGLQISVNGTIDAVTHNVTLVEYSGGKIYQENSAGEWYTESQPNSSWVQTTDPSGTVSTDKLVLSLSEDAYNGNAQFIAKVDGKQIAGPTAVTVLHSSGQSQDFTFQQAWGAGTHSVEIDFINDAYGGSHSKDRNLYINKVNYDGVSYGAMPKELLNNSSFTVIVGHS